ncbi:MAG: hypothetical protein AAFY48_09515 [Bacteroidota bacterium]
MDKRLYFPLLMLPILVSCNEANNATENNNKETDMLRPSIRESYKQEMIIGLASVLHEEWRNNRLLPDGKYQPRLKTTTDNNWINSNNTDQVDIANTSFTDLPTDWQEENLAASTVAMSEVFSAYERGVKLNTVFIEKASEKVHVEWLVRNSEWAPDNQKLPYAQLAEEEQDKDRLQVLMAIEVFQKGLLSVTEDSEK